MNATAMPDPTFHPFSDAKAFKVQIVAMANRLQESLTGDFSQIQELVDTNDIVFAVWPDLAEPDGVGTLIVKGHARLREVLVAGEARVAAITAIPCIEFAQAVALQQVAGEPDRRH